MHGDQTQIAHRLQELLIDNNMKQTELATHLDVDPSVISTWINGRRTIPQKNIEDIADVFGLPLPDVQHFGCEIPILGEVRENYQVVQYDTLTSKKRVKCKTVFLPADCVGYIYVSETPFNWRDQMIFIARVRKGGMVDQRKIHHKSDGRLCLIAVNNKKMIAIPRKKQDGSWDLFALGDNRILVQSADIQYSLPILCQLPNWSVLPYGFHETLEY